MSKTYTEEQVIELLKQSEEVILKDIQSSMSHNKISDQKIGRVVKYYHKHK